MLSIRLFGRLEVSNEAGETLVVSGRKRQALLAYLALNVDKPPSRDHLAALLWGDFFDEQARQNLRQSISRLRNTLFNGEPSVLFSDGDYVGLSPDSVDIDARNFERHTSEGSPEALAKVLGRLIRRTGATKPSPEHLQIAKHAIQR